MPVLTQRNSQEQNQAQYKIYTQKRNTDKLRHIPTTYKIQVLRIDSETQRKLNSLVYAGAVFLTSLHRFITRYLINKEVTAPAQSTQHLIKQQPVERKMWHRNVGCGDTYCVMTVCVFKTLYCIYYITGNTHILIYSCSSELPYESLSSIFKQGGDTYSLSKQKAYQGQQWTIRCRW